jgi:hypothetical protein
MHEKENAYKAGSARLFVFCNSGTASRIFMILGIGIFFEELSSHFSLNLNWTCLTTSCEDLRTVCVCVAKYSSERKCFKPI